MSKDLHNMDDIFNSAYRQFEEEPSSGVWEKIDAGLDKKDAESYKRRLTGWKRVAILLLLLLTGFVLYESGILKTGLGHSKENIPVVAGAKKTDTSIVTAGKNETINHNKTFTGHKKEEGIADFNTVNATVKKNVPDKKIKEQKQGLLNEKINAVNEKDQIAITTPGPDKKKNDLLKDGESLPKEKINRTLLIEQSIFEKMISEVRSVIKEDQLPPVKNSLLMSSVAKSATPKKINFFKRYWAITGYVSDDRANYRLDDDLPAIEKIKQREEHEPSFSGGVLLTYQLKRQWGLQTGLIYSNIAIGISPQKMYALQDQNGDVSYKYITSSGYAYIKPGFGSPPSPGDSLVTARAKHTLQHIVVPVIIKYTIATNNKFSFTSGAGIAGNFLTSAKVETEIEDAFNRENVFINKLHGERSFYWSVVADAEVQYKLNKKISVNLHPAFRYAISPITKNNDVETFPYSFGLGLGATYKF